MPRPLACFAIVAFWLVTSAWLICRDVVPRLLAGEPPAYTIDLTETVSANPVNWHILYSDPREEAGELQPIGRLETQVERLPDRTFEMRAVARMRRLEKDEGFVLLKTVEIRKVTGSYRVTEDGQLRGISGRAEGRVHLGGKTPLEGSIDFHGVVADGRLTPEVAFTQGTLELFRQSFEPVKVSEGGSVMNPMHPVNRLPGLRTGQHWEVPLLDLVSVLSEGPLRGFTDQVRTVRALHAEVSDGALEWDGAEVACHVIEYREPGKTEPTARTWVRRRDGLVLRQQALYEGKTLVLMRVPVR